jgi:hypothetical protein
MELNRVLSLRRSGGRLLLAWDDFCSADAVAPQCADQAHGGFWHFAEVLTRPSAGSYRGQSRH